jgi:hypothetical protein
MVGDITLPDDLILKWDARKEDARKHGKFDHIWCGPFRFIASEGKNSFLLENLDEKVLNKPTIVFQNETVISRDR